MAGDGLPSKDAIAGEDTNTLDTPAGRVGIVISWEVFFGDRGRDAIDGRGEVGQILLNPTNGSSYPGTLVQSQQIGSSRLRSIETGRWEVQAAPTGFSAFVSPSGEVFQRSAVSERRVETRDVPLRDGRTLYLTWGEWPTLVLALGLVVAAWAVPALLARRRSSDLTGPPTGTWQPAVASRPRPDISTGARRSLIAASVIGGGSGPSTATQGAGRLARARPGPVLAGRLEPASSGGSRSATPERT